MNVAADRWSEVSFTTEYWGGDIKQIYIAMNVDGDSHDVPGEKTLFVTSLSSQDGEVWIVAQSRVGNTNVSTHFNPRQGEEK